MNHFSSLLSPPFPDSLTSHPLVSPLAWCIHRRGETSSQLLNLGQSFSVQVSLSPSRSSFGIHFSSVYIRRVRQWNRFVSQTCGHESDHFSTGRDLFPTFSERILFHVSTTCLELITNSSGWPRVTTFTFSICSLHNNPKELNHPSVYSSVTLSRSIIRKKRLKAEKIISSFGFTLLHEISHSKIYFCLQVKRSK